MAKSLDKEGSMVHNELPRDFDKNYFYLTLNSDENTVTKDNNGIKTSAHEII